MLFSKLHDLQIRAVVALPCADEYQDPREMEANNNDSKHGDSEDVGTSSLDLARPGIDQNRSGEEEQRHKIDALEKRLRRKEVLEFWFAAAIAVSTVSSAFVASLQWHTMDRQLEEMRGSGLQTDRLIGQVAEQSQVARESLAESRLQFQRDQRPYVMPKAVPLTFEPNREVAVNLYSGNYGKTPAMKVGGAAKIFLGDNALIQAYRWFDKEAPKVFARSNGAVIPPGTPASGIDAIRSTIATDYIVSEQEFASLTKKNFSIIVTFRQAYLDTAGNEYWTDMCVGFLVPNAIVNCPLHNEVH